MTTRATLPSLAALLLILQLTPVIADGGPVVIRTYDYTGIPTAELALAWDAVRLIFEEAGIAVEWKPCPVTPMNDSSAIAQLCGEMLQPNEFVLRLLTSSPETSAPSSASFSASAGQRRSALGYSLIDRNSASGPLLMTVFPDLVWNLARDARADHPSMLGRAIAHELGHLLLGTVVHSDGGLMRAFWSLGEIQRNSRADWLIRPGQARHMRDRVASRNGN